MNSVRIRVPATTANVGPGFDTLGIAVGLYNEVEIILRPKGGGQKTENRRRKTEDGNQDLVKNSALGMLSEAGRLFFKKSGLKPRPFDVQITGDVPVARGLGSSVTVRLGVLAGLNELCGRPLDRMGLFQWVAELEGHPDNAAPAVFGGLAVSGRVGESFTLVRRKLSSHLRFVAAIPDFEVKTSEARKLLPQKVSFQEAVHNMNRTALLVAALWSGRLTLAVHDLRRARGEGLWNLLDDRLHQPFRSKRVPQLYPALEAARKADALGGWLSGSGSTLMAIARGRSIEIGRAMQKVFERTGHSCVVRVLKPDNEGMKVMKN